MDDDKDYQKSEFAKRVEELMDDGFEFGEAVKEAMKEGYKSGGPVGIEILFTEKVPAAPSQLVSESDILLGYRGDDAARSDRASGRKSGRADPRGGVDRSAVSEGSQYARNVAAQNNEPSFKEKVKSFVTNPAVQTLGGAVLTGGINTAFPGVLDKLNKARMISNAIKYGKDIAIEDELENITTQGGIVPYADGGRVGLFMGGPPLEGIALSIYNSMNAYGFSDQEIANALAERGLYTPGGSTPDAPDEGIINQQLQTGGGGGDGGPQGIATPKQYFDKTYVGDDPDYTGPKTFPDGTPIMGGFEKTEGPGFLDSITNAFSGLAGLYKKYSPIGMIGRKIEQNKQFKQAQTNKAIEQAEMQRKIREAEEAAAAAALANAKRIGRMPTAPSGGDGGGGGGVQDSGGPTGGYSYDSGGREGFGYGLKDGGVATMFRNKR